MAVAVLRVVVPGSAFAVLRLAAIAVVVSLLAFVAAVLRVDRAPCLVAIYLVRKVSKGRRQTDILSEGKHGLALTLGE